MNAPIQLASREVKTLIEEPVLAVLDIVRGIYPDAFLAGGYLRDRVLGLKPKDIDIFTRLPIIPAHQGNVLDQGSQNIAESRVVCVQEYYSQYMIDEIGFPYPVEIIHLNPEQNKDMYHAVSQFAFGVMQVFYDQPENLICCTPAFYDDVNQRTMTVCRCEGQDAAYAIWMKFRGLRKTKFEGWTLVVPDKWAEWFAPFVEQVGE